MKFIVELLDEEILAQSPIDPKQVGRSYVDIAADEIRDSLEYRSGFHIFRVFPVQPGDVIAEDVAATIRMEIESALRKHDVQRFGRLHELLTRCTEGGVQ